MITNDQFQEIKRYVLSRLSKEGVFFLSADEMRASFGVQKPFYKELIKLNEEDGRSFSTDGKYPDKNGDPSEPIRFYLQ